MFIMRFISALEKTIRRLSGCDTFNNAREQVKKEENKWKWKKKKKNKIKEMRKTNSDEVCDNSDTRT